MKLKRADYVLILIVILLCSCLYYYVKIHSNTVDAEEAKVVISRYGKDVEEYSLNEENKYEFKSGDDINEFEIKDGKVKMTHANCPDKYCIKQGSIDSTGEQIVCLPHGLVIRIERTGKPEKEDIDIIR